MATEGAQKGSTAPADDYFPITPADGADLSVTVRALVIAVGGDVKVTKPNGDAVTLTLPAGATPIRVVRVWSTGTTATGITGLV